MDLSRRVHMESYPAHASQGYVCTLLSVEFLDNDCRLPSHWSFDADSQLFAFSDSYVFFLKNKGVWVPKFLDLWNFRFGHNAKRSGNGFQL